MSYFGGGKEEGEGDGKGSFSGSQWGGIRFSELLILVSEMLLLLSRYLFRLSTVVLKNNQKELKRNYLCTSILVWCLDQGKEKGSREVQCRLQRGQWSSFSTGGGISFNCAHNGRLESNSSSCMWETERQKEHFWPGILVWNGDNGQFSRGKNTPSFLGKTSRLASD